MRNNDKRAITVSCGGFISVHHLTAKIRGFSIYKHIPPVATAWGGLFFCLSCYLKILFSCKTILTGISTFLEQLWLLSLSVKKRLKRKPLILIFNIYCRNLVSDLNVNFSNFHWLNDISLSSQSWLYSRDYNYLKVEIVFHCTSE